MMFPAEITRLPEQRFPPRSSSSDLGVYEESYHVPEAGRPWPSTLTKRRNFPTFQAATPIAPETRPPFEVVIFWARGRSRFL